MGGKKNLRRVLRFTTFRFLFLLGAVFLGCSGSDLNFPTQYQAVFLDNGQVFFGRLDAAGSPFLTLRDVFYVRTVTERDKKETRNLLMKRGAEWHAPDFMRVNSRHVVLIEPVAPDSRVAQLLLEAMAPPAAPPKETGPAPTPPAAPAKPAQKGPGGR